MIDPHALILDFLLSDTALADLVAGRIYAARDVPPPNIKPGEGDCLVFRIRGGNTHYDDALLSPSVQFKSYSVNEARAYQVYRALRDWMQNGRSAHILHSEEETIGQPLEEPDTEWRYVLSFFLVMLRQ